MRKYLDYKNKIEGFKDVEETIRVVEKAAASRIHFLKKRTEDLMDYKKEVEAILARISELKLDENHPLLKERYSGKKALIVVGGDRGIVGGLYHNLVGAFLQKKDSYDYVWVLGKKTKDYLSEEGVETEQFSFESADTSFFRLYRENDIRNVDILYPKFISIIEQTPAFVKFLPFDFAPAFAKAAAANKDNPAEGLPIFEQSKKDIFDALLTKYIEVFFRQIRIEAKLSEFSARTITAEHAIYKTDGIIKKLRLSFFKERKKEISQKQLESFVSIKL